MKKRTPRRASSHYGPWHVMLDNSDKPMQPPPIIAFFCEYLIEPGEHETLRPEPIARR